MKIEYYATYAPDSDITFIMRDVWDGDEPIEMEVVGWYHGEPDWESTTHFIGKTKATYDLR